ncbi:MAG: class I SAM-dependent methyltransferase [Vicinamibacterales bacterium]
MSVASHLGIETAAYDRLILTFIPFYAEMLDEAASALAASGRPARALLDLGTGSGALASRCLARVRGARVVGIDSDAAMLDRARARLGRRLTAVVGAFESTPFPRCDAVTASFSLHHVASPAVKRRLFARAFEALRPGGLLIEADCLPADDPRLQARDREAWRRHLAASHGAAGARRFLAAWSREDTYFPVSLEVALLRRAGFRVDVVWRRASFAVIAAAKPGRVR